MKTLLMTTVLFAATQAAVLPATGLADGLGAPQGSDRMATGSRPLRLAGLVPVVGDGSRQPSAAPREAEPGRPPLAPPPFGPNGRRGPPTAEMLAVRLAAMEVAVGIRADQLDAWRDFTDALLGVVAPPQPVRPNPQAHEPFVLAQRLAADAVERGRHAEALQHAIATLEKTLSPEQLDRAARFRGPRSPSLMPPPRELPPPGPDDPPAASPDRDGVASPPPAGPVD